MKKTFSFLALAVFVLLAGVGTKLLAQNFSASRIPLERSIIKTKDLNIPISKTEIVPFAPTATILAESPQNPPKEYSAEELALDIKRGSFLTEDIKKQLAKTVQNQVVNNVRVAISKVVRKDSRAFVNICMKSEQTTEVLDFGKLYIDYPGGRAENSIVHQDIAPIDQTRCLLMEFVSIPPSVSSDDWKLTMERVGFVLPDEGTECDVYTRRAEMDPTLSKSGIQFACKKNSRFSELQIISAPENLTTEQANDILHRAVSGITDGPWGFRFNAE